MAEQLSATEELQLGLSKALYGVARVLRLSKLRDLLSAARLGPDATVYLLGRRYCCPPHATEAQQEEALARMLLHFHSIPWMTYRTGFTPIAVGDVQLRSDAGWGCTLRSGQMILALGLQRHLLGPDWRWPQPPEQHGTATAAGAAAAAATEAPAELARLLQLFWDTPAERNPFSLHNLCLHGRRAGVVPGRWLGPWVMCRALEAAAAAAQAHHDLGVTVAVLADAGGGAPLLVASRFKPAFAGSGSSSGGGIAGPSGCVGSKSDQQGQRQQQNGPSTIAAAEETAEAAAASVTAEAAAAAAEDSQPELVPVDSCTLAVEAPAPAAALAASTGHLSLKNGAGTGGSRGLILLVPLTLGIGKLNPRYAPQLEAVLTWPQSIGIVGGRPSSSLYFVGCQLDTTASTAGTAAGTTAGAAGAVAGTAAGAPQAVAAGDLRAAGGSGSGASEGAAGAASSCGSVIYLDPHQVQEAACCDADWLSFRCEAPRSRPTASIDPSLALGFYCGSLDEYRDLCSRLAALERASGGAPLVCVTTAEAAAAAAAYDSLRASEWEPDEMSSGGLSEAEPASDEEEQRPGEKAEDEAAAAAEDEVAAAEAVAAAQAEAAARQRQLEEEPELLVAPPTVAASSAAGMTAPGAAAAAAAGSPRSPPGVQGPQQVAAAAAAASSPRQPSLTPRHSRGWELL